MNKKKKTILLVVAILIITATAGGACYYFSSESYQVKKKLAGNQKLLDEYAKLQELEKQEAQSKNPDLARIFAIGLAWKGLGDMTKDQFFYQKSLTVYQQGIEYFKDKNVLLYWNAGKLAEYVNDYALAESYYRQSIKISPGYDDPYRNLADLYQFKIHKDLKDVIAVYNEGLEASGGSVNLFLEKCSYLRFSGQYQDALACYQTLSKNYPDNAGYKDEVKELENKLKE